MKGLPYRPIGLVTLTLIGTSLQGQLVYTESFSSENAPGWEFQIGASGTNPPARLTANAVPDSTDPEFGAPQIDVNGNGWLRLATTNGNQANAVALDTAIPSTSNTIRVSFDFAFWKPGTNPADGITVFMWDAGQPFAPGAFGGSLGYAQKTGIDGLAGAYVGVGLDVFGNYSNATEGRVDGPGFLPNEVAVRGPGSGTTGYNYLEGTGAGGNPALTGIFGSGFRMDFINSPTRPDQDAADFRHFEMELDATNNLTLWMQNGYDGTLTEILQTNVTGTRPDQLRIGFSGATGGSIEVYEIRNLEVTATGGANSFYWDDENGNELWGTGTNWDQDTVPTNHSFVVFSDAFPDTQVDQTVNVDGGDKIVSSATFSGASSYELNPTGSQTLIFDTNGNGKSYLNVLNSPNGNADHTLNVDLEADNDLDIQNLVNQTLTLNGDLFINNHDLTFETTGVTEVSGVIGGSGLVTTSGQGTTIFSNNNSYTASTTIESGRLQIEDSGALGASGSDTFVESGGSLALAGNISSDSGEMAFINGDGNQSTGAIVNASGNNTWQGQVQLDSNSMIGAEAGTLAFGNQVNANDFDLTVQTADGTTIDFNGVINGSTSDFTKTGTGTAILSVGNNYGGETTITAGTLRIENNGALGNTDGDTVVQSGATLEFAGVGNISALEAITAAGTGVVGKAALWGATGTSEIDSSVTVTGGTTLIGADTGATLALDGGIDGAGQNVIITGTGTTVYKGPQGSQSGFTQIDSGATLLFGDAGNRINDNSAVMVNGTLDMDSSGYNDTIGSLAGSGTVRTRGATLTAGGDNTTTTFSGSIQDAGNFVKDGTGSMTFSGANTMSGTMTVNNGSVMLGANNAFADAMDLTLNGGTFATSGFADTMDLFTLSSNSTLDFMGMAGGYLTFSDMTRSGGTLTIDNWAGNFSGNGGTRLQVLDNNLGSFGTGPGALSNITFAGYGGAQLIDLGGGTYEVVPSLSGFYEWTSNGGSGPNNWDQDNNWAGPSGFPNSQTALAYIGTADANLDGRAIELNGNRTVRTLVIDNDDAFSINESTLIFNAPGNNTETNYLTVIGGSSPTFNSNLRFTEPALFANNSTGTVTVNGQIQLNDGSNAPITFTGSGTTVLNGNITDNSNQGEVTVDGTGTVEFHGNNSFSDGFILNNGTVLVGSNTALGDGTLTFNGGTVAATGANRTLDETYTINNDLTFGNSGDNTGLTLSANGSISQPVALTVESGVTTTLSGIVSGDHELTKQGAGTLSLTGANTFDNLVVDSGTVTSTLGGNLLIGGSGTGTSVFGDGNVSVNAGGTLTSVSGSNVEIGDGSTLTNTGGTANITAGANVTFDGNFNQTGGTTTFTAGASGDIITDPNATLSIAGGTANFNAGDDFTTANNNSAISVTNGATANVNLSTGDAASTFTLAQNDTLTVDGAASNFNVTTETNGTVNLNGTINLNNQGTMTVTQGATVFGANATFDGGNAATAGTLEVRDDLTFTAGMDVANAPNLLLNIASGNSLLTASAADTNIENLGTITKSGDGSTTLGSNLNNLQATKIVINGGTLLNSTSNQIENGTPMQFGDNTLGSTTPTWNVNDHNEVLGTLTLSNNSSVNLNLGSAAGDGSIVRFANSAAEAWSGSGELVIQGWNGSYGGGGTDQLYIGSSSLGVTNAQLQRIFFQNPPGLPAGLYQAQILSTGEIVPIPVPEPGTYAAGSALLLGLSLFEWRRRGRKRFEGA